MTDARFSTDGGPALILNGTGARPLSVELVGPRAKVAATLTGGGKTWRAVLPLRAARWGFPELPLPVGAYELSVDLPAGAEVVELPELPLTQLGTLRAQLTGSTVQVGPPVDPAYDSGEGQDALERRYATRPRGLENAVFFESFWRDARQA
jgi:CDP-glycerol glycerophosphotransferase